MNAVTKSNPGIRPPARRVQAATATGPAGRHAGGRTTRTAGKHKPGQKRLQMARGAGSINAKADILQLLRAARHRDAGEMAIEHELRCGERLFVAERDLWVRS